MVPSYAPSFGFVEFLASSKQSQNQPKGSFASLYAQPDTPKESGPMRSLFWLSIFLSLASQPCTQLVIALPFHSRIIFLNSHSHRAHLIILRHQT